MHDLRYIDIHGHLNFPEYDEDREEAISRAQNSGVGMISVGTSAETSKQAVELAHTHEGMWAVVGIHPTETKDSINFPALSALAEDRQVVGIGECGLDYFRTGHDQASKDIQREVFEQHIFLANKVKKPLMLHVRNGKGASSTSQNSGRNAYQEAVDMLSSSAKVPANFHFFAGSMENLKAILDIGGTVSFTGVITFARDYDELIRYAPLTSILSETDCPYVAPAPYRGKRNEPSFVIETVKAIAEIRGQDLETVQRQLFANARRIFGLN